MKSFDYTFIIFVIIIIIFTVIYIILSHKEYFPNLDEMFISPEFHEAGGMD